MNVALLVLRLVPGLLFMGHGLQKLVPARLSPPLLSAHGPRAIAAGFEQMALAPGLPLALLAGAGELGGGFLLAAGLVTLLVPVRSVQEDVPDERAGYGGHLLGADDEHEPRTPGGELVQPLPDRG